MTAQDLDGAISSVRLFNEGTQLGIASRVGTTSTYKYNWTPTVPGSYTIIAKATNVENVEATSNSVQITAIATPVIDSISVTMLTPTTGQLSASASDGGPAANLMYTWATKGDVPAAVTFNATNGLYSSRVMPVTFQKAGYYNFEVTVVNAQGQTVKATVGLNVPQILTSLSMSPNHRTIQVGQPTYFFVSAKDQFQHALQYLPAIQWTSTGGTITNGIFYAETAGDYTVYAVYGTVSTQATVTVVGDPVSTNTPPFVVTPAHANPNPVDGYSTELSVLGDDDENEPNLIYAWSLVSGPADVKFDHNESNVAKETTVQFDKAGTYVISVAIIDEEGLSVASSETVVVNQTVTNVQVTPFSATVAQDGEQQYNAIVFDQFFDEVVPSGARAIVVLERRRNLHIKERMRLKTRS